VVYASNDVSLGFKCFVSMPLEEMLKKSKKNKDCDIVEVVTIGSPLMVRAICDLT
jgi:glutamate synthase (NADPH/NADH) small chain